MYKLDLFISGLLMYSEEFFTILLVFSFLNFIFATIILDLLWPTHFFNNKYSTVFKTFHPRIFSSILLKPHSKNKNFYFFYKNTLR